MDEPALQESAAEAAASAGPARTVEPEVGRQARRLALVVVCVAVFLTALDQTVVVTALVAMQPDLQVPDTAFDRAAWIVSGYLLGYIIAMPLMGRVSDIYGRRRVFGACLAIFGVGSVLCALAPMLGGAVAPDSSTLAGAVLQPLYWLAQQALGLATLLGVDPTYPQLNVMVAARFIQAVGGGALVPVALAVVGDLFGMGRRGLALGVVGAVAEAGGVLGPLWGAWVSGAWGWQWIFWLNLPVVALLLIAGGVSLPHRRQARRGIDLAGALLFGAAVTCLTIGLGAQTGQLGAPGVTARAAAFNPVLLGLAALLLVAFVLLEWRLRAPVVEMRLFGSTAFSAAAALSLLIGAALILALVMVPVFAILVLGRSTLDAGLILLRLTALIPIGALAGGWLSGHLGVRPTAALGCLLTALGFWLMHAWPIDVSGTQITLASMVAGLGFGLVIAPISTSALNAVRAERTGTASSVITMLRMVGMILGLAALTAWAFTRFQQLVAGHPVPLPQSGESTAAYQAQVQAFTAQVVVPATHQVYTDIFAVAAVLCLLGIVPALLLWRPRRDSTGETPEAVYEYVAPLA